MYLPTGTIAFPPIYHVPVFIRSSCSCIEVRDPKELSNVRIIRTNGQAYEPKPLSVASTGSPKYDKDEDRVSRFKRK